MNIKEKIGERIASARKEAGLTIKQLAERTLSLKPARIGNWEQGTRTPGVQEVKQLAAVLSVSAAYLLCLTDEEGDTASIPMPMVVPLLDNQQAVHPKNRSIKTQQAKIETSTTYDTIPVGKNIADMMGPDTFAMVIDDLSMAPDFKPGEIIIIDTDKKPNPGQYILARLENEDHVMFRKFRDRGTNPEGTACFDLIPINPDWATITVDESSIAQIIGTMLEHRRMG